VLHEIGAAHCGVQYLNSGRSRWGVVLAGEERFNDSSKYAKERKAFGKQIGNLE